MKVLTTLVYGFELKGGGGGGGGCKGIILIIIYIMQPTNHEFIRLYELFLNYIENSFLCKGYFLYTFFFFIYFYF